MKTIEEREWSNYKGELMFLDEVKQEVAKVSNVLLTIANAYQPSQEFTLNIAEIRKLNKAVEVLEAAPFEDDNKFWFEDDHFAVLQKVVLSLVPRIPNLARSAGEVEDLFTDNN